MQELKEAHENGIILVVDDEADLREMVQSILCELTPQVITAADGVEALELFHTHRPHAIVSDLRMPRKGGLELLSDLRSLQEQVPFVIMTGFEDKESLLAAIRLGASDFLEKPFRPEYLEEVMKKALGLGLAQAQLEKNLEDLYEEAELPRDQIDRMRKIRSAILRMKYENALHKRKVG